MPLLKQAFEKLSFEMGKGRGECHVNELVVIEDLVREQTEEPKPLQPKTRVAFKTDPLTYQQWHIQKDRWIKLCGGNPTLAYPLMVEVLKSISDEAIAGLYEAGI